MDQVFSWLNLSMAASKALTAAFRNANSQNISAQHLFLGVLEVDPGLMVKLKIKGINLLDLIGQTREVVATEGPRDTKISITLLQLSSLIAHGIPVNTPHLLAAIISHRLNPISQYLERRSIDIAELLRRKFQYLPRALEVYQGYSHSSEESIDRTSLTTDDILSQLFARLIGNEVDPLAKNIPWREQLNHSVTAMNANPEKRAIQWLDELIPEQAQHYARKRFIEIPSSLYRQRRYRIYNNARTVMFKNGKTIGSCCIHPQDSWLPPTDRVIAEYFLIKGNEESYLKTANVTRVH